jgi:hypothetical protein
VQPILDNTKSERQRTDMPLKINNAQEIARANLLPRTCVHGERQGFSGQGVVGKLNMKTLMKDLLTQ